jgi:protein gp37
MGLTKIEWTDKTWNPVTGCSQLSSGCLNCYAKTMAYRLQAMGMAKYINGFTPTLHINCLEEPIKWKQPHTIFVCSMSDLFHEAVPFSFIDKVIDVINQTKQHFYQILTKRVDRMLSYFNQTFVPKNVWLGVTVEDNVAKKRIEILKQLESSIRFISCEPLIGDLGILDLTGINWVIVGGETGVSARIMKPDWVRSILEQSKEQKVAFFFKQWGTWGSDGIKRTKKANGKSLDGKLFQMMPKLQHQNL